MSESEPVKVMLASCVPSPDEKESPLICDSDSTPFATDSVTCMVSPPTSLSAIEMALPPLNTRSVSSLTACGPGTVLTGASLTASTVIATESVSPCAPPEPVLARSLTVRLSESGPA